MHRPFKTGEVGAVPITVTMIFEKKSPLQFKWNVV